MEPVPSKKPRRSALILTLSASIIALSLATAPSPAWSAEPVRVTTSFDAKYTPAVLRQVARLFEAGFGRAEAERVARDIDALRADQPRAWQFTVQYRGQQQPLQVHALLDDLGMIDLDFATSPELAPMVRAAVDGYLNGRGR
jgi:hypothetical protein